MAPATTAPPRFDPEANCTIPNLGQWPVDPQEDEAIQDSRIWVDGCFDFFHHGHAGVMLQTARLGQELYVGLHSDEAIAANKGPTVMNLDERVAAVEACRFATKCVPHAPYVTSLPWIEHYGCKYVGHGDDITSDATGQDAYRVVKKAGRMKIVPRTPGISTTDLVGRMLLCTKSHFIKSLPAMLVGDEGKASAEDRQKKGVEMKKRITEYAAAPNGKDPYVSIYAFRPKHRSIERRRSSIKASNGDIAVELAKKPTHDPGKGHFEQLVAGHAPRPGQRVVYVDGGFDLFSSGHIAFLESVTALERKLGEDRGWYTDEAKSQRIKEHNEDYPPAYVVAGIHDDTVVNFWRGINFPIMNIYERGLCVIQCRYIHAVIFSAPHIPTAAYLSSLPSQTNFAAPPDAVYHGPTEFLKSPHDEYADAKGLGIFREVEKHRFQNVDSAQIVQRILDKRGQYEERQRRKGEKAVGEEAEGRREKLEKEAERERARMIREVEKQFGA